MRAEIKNAIRTVKRMKLPNKMAAPTRKSLAKVGRNDISICWKNRVFFDE